MHIGIDCRLGGLKGAGIGRYISQLVKRLCTSETHEWTLVCNSLEQFEELTASLSKRNKPNCIVAAIPHYGWREQIFLPSILHQQKFDLLHVPHFNVPVFYRGQLIITIHDLLWHDTKGARATTLPAWQYWIKYFFYRLVVSIAILKTDSIIVPSNQVMRRLIKSYSWAQHKIAVIYEGGGEQFKKYARSAISNQVSSGHNLLMVGSLYPHKNIEVLLQLLLSYPEYHLTIVTARTVFLDRLQDRITDFNLASRITIKKNLSDSQLAQEYTKADVFVFPSLSEGFGLPGLEAMQLGTPVVAADTPIFREIYDSAAIYFSPNSHRLLQKAITDALAHSSDLIRLGTIRAQYFSWDRMAAQTLSLYEASARSTKS